MKNNFKWNKEQMNGKWFSVCDHEHVPMIEHIGSDGNLLPSKQSGGLF